MDANSTIEVSKIIDSDTFFKIIAIIGAFSWTPFVISLFKRRKVSASLIHCRFFNGFSIPLLRPDFIANQRDQGNTYPEKGKIPSGCTDIYSGAIIVVGMNILSVNKPFIVDRITATINMDKSSHEAIAISPDVKVYYFGTHDQAEYARLVIPDKYDMLKIKNILADINTRLYGVLLCKDMDNLDYDKFNSLSISFFDFNNKEFKFVITKDTIKNSSLIVDREVYDVDFLAKIKNRLLYESLPGLTSQNQIPINNVKTDQPGSPDSAQMGSK